MVISAKLPYMCITFSHLSPSGKLLFSMTFFSFGVGGRQYHLSGMALMIFLHMGSAITTNFGSPTLCRTLSVLQFSLSGLPTELAMVVTALWRASASGLCSAPLPTITMGLLAEASSLLKGCLPLAISWSVLVESPRCCVREREREREMVQS